MERFPPGAVELVEHAIQRIQGTGKAIKKLDKPYRTKLPPSAIKPNEPFSAVEQFYEREALGMDVESAIERLVRDWCGIPYELHWEMTVISHERMEYGVVKSGDESAPIWLPLHLSLAVTFTKSIREDFHYLGSADVPPSNPCAGAYVNLIRNLEGLHCDALVWAETQKGTLIRNADWTEFIWEGKRVYLTQAQILVLRNLEVKRFKRLEMEADLNINQKVSECFRGNRTRKLYQSLIEHEKQLGHRLRREIVKKK